VEEAVYLASRVVVLSSADGRPVADLPSPGAAPHPAGWRADPAFRAAVEAVTGAMAKAMAA